MTGWARWWPVTGIAFVVLWIVAAIVSDGSPETGDDDQEIVSYFTDGGNRARQFVAFFLILAAILVFVWFLASLRRRLVEVEGAPAFLTALAFGAGLISSALWLGADAIWSAPAGAYEDTDKFQLDPNTFRILNDLGYDAWFMATTIAALAVVAVSLVALRTGLLPRWLAWLGFPVAVTMLVAFFFIPFLIMLGWLLVTSISLIVRPAPPAAALAP